MKLLLTIQTLILAICLTAQAWGQTSEAPVNTPPTSNEGAQEKLDKTIDEIAGKVNENETAQKARTSILGWIYDAAEYLSFSWFHWVAFALMVAGLVSFSLQLVVGKLIMLLHFHFNLTEILSDGLGFVISAIGLILTTQAATDKSGFTESPSLVLSAAAVGLLFGLVFFIRGQTQEYREGREVRRRQKST
jgi:hypothetical protein